MSAQHIIFDLDGTIIDSKKEIQKVYRMVFDHIPPPAYPEVEKLDYGLNINNLLASVYGEGSSLIPQAKSMFSATYDKSDFEETTLYEGVYDTLQQLKENGNILYIATNKRYTPTLRILEVKEILNLFSSVFANEMQPGISLNKRQMIAAVKQKGLFLSGYMVGDSIYDIMAGKEENLTTIAVTYGYDDEAHLMAKNPDYIIHHFKDLYTIPGIRY